MALKTKSNRSKAQRPKKQGSKKQAAKASSAPGLRIFRDIETLLTLSGAAAKEGRHITSEDLSPLSKAAVVEQGGRVVWVGPMRRLPREYARVQKVRELSLKGFTVLPAFVECHTHLVFGGHRADEFEKRNRGASYQEIAREGGGILSTMRATRKASPDGLAKVARRHAEAFVRQGVTTIEAKSGYALNTPGELKMLRAAGEVQGPRIVRTYLGAHAIPPEFKDAGSYLDHLLKNDLPKVKKEGLASRVDIFVEDGYFPADLARPWLKKARAMGFDIVVHADQITRSGGAGLAVELQARSAEHLVRINDDDIRRLAESEVTAVLLPGADLYLNCPYPPARKLIDGGARVALATDFNPGSCPSQDLSLMGVLARIQMKMSLPEVIAAYTVGGAYALGLGRDLGALEPGRLCDFLSTEADWQELFYRVGGNPVSGVWREGRALLFK